MFSPKELETYRFYLEDLISVSDAAKLRHLNESSIRKAVKTKRLKISKKIGASHLVSRTEVLEMVVVGHRPRKEVTNFVNQEEESC